VKNLDKLSRADVIFTLTTPGRTFSDTASALGFFRDLRGRWHHGPVMSEMAPSFHRSVLAAVYRLLNDKAFVAQPERETEPEDALGLTAWHPAAAQLEQLDRHLPGVSQRSSDTLVKLGYEVLRRHPERLDGDLRAHTPCYAIYALEKLLSRIANYGSVSLVRHRLFDASLDLQMQPSSPAMFSMLEGAILAALEHVGATEAQVSHVPHERGAQFFMRWE
jgi:hypothetical protein